MEITIKSDFGNVARSIEDLGITKRERAFFHKDAINIIKEHSDKIFKTSGAKSSGGRWKPLSARTRRARKKRQGYYKRSPNRPGILRWTGNLQDNVRKEHNERRGEIEWQAEHAKYHMRGRNKRVFAEINNRVVNDMIKELQKMLESKIQRFNNNKL